MRGKRFFIIWMTFVFFLFIFPGLILKKVYDTAFLVEQKYILLEEQNKKAMEVIQNAFEEEKRLIREERENISRELVEATEHLEEVIATGTSRTNRNIASTNQLVGQIEYVYAELLAEQQKKTLDSLYREGAVIDAGEEAYRLFMDGQYRRANELFIFLTEEQPEDQDAWFYRYYSLFLINKNDRGQYRGIREGFSLLERLGYTRPEMQEVIDYMTTEERGVAPVGGR
jgi:hypothetical protein